MVTALTTSLDVFRLPGTVSVSLVEVLLDTDRRAEARGPAEEAVRLYQSLGNEVGEARARNVLARVRPGNPPPVAA